MVSERGPVTAVVTRDVIPGRESDYEEWAHRVVSASARYGATGHTFLTPDPAVPTRRVLIAQFPDEDGVRAWDESEEHDHLVNEAEEFSSLHIQRASGLETWFVLPGRRAIFPPPRWKQLLATLVGAYPLVVLMSAFVLPRNSDLAALAALHGAPGRAAHTDDLCGYATGDEGSAGLALPAAAGRDIARADSSGTGFC